MHAETHLEWHEYLHYLSNTEFCLCPRGAKVWSPRLMEAVWFGCIPVVLADFYWLPQGCFWNWEHFAVIVPESDVAQTAELVRRSANDTQWVRRARTILQRIREHFMYNIPSPRLGDAFEMAMLEVRLKQGWCQTVLETEPITQEASAAREKAKTTASHRKTASSTKTD